MWNVPTPGASIRNSLRGVRLRSLCVLISALAPLTGHAQTVSGTTVTTVMRSGLHSFSPEHYALLTVAETGAVGSSAQVTIEFRDDTDALVAATTGELRRGNPVRLRTPLNASGDLVQFRTILRIMAVADAGSAPVAVLEDVGPDSLIARIVVCGPPARTGGGQEYCPDWALTTK